MEISNTTKINNMNTEIPFNKPCVLPDSEKFLIEALHSGKLSGNGEFTKKCQTFFEEKYHFPKVLLTTSGTDALEMAALLIGIKEGDEVIVPSYTFVSSALAFTRQGAKIVFADSENNTPNIDVSQIERLITPKTKAIVPVHYAGVSVDMDKLIEIAKRHEIYVIEDAAQAIDSYYKGRPVGSLGDLACFSFHDTKNITAAEGGMLVVNNPDFIRRSEIIWEKGTNRSEFFRGEVNKYGWVDTGSSFLPSELNAAMLYSQLIHLQEIQSRRIEIWNKYYDGLKSLASEGKFNLPFIPEYATNNAHMFYLVCNTAEDRNNLISYLKKNNIHAVFHYLSLHKSKYAEIHNQNNQVLPNSALYTDRLVRLPLYYSMSDSEVEQVIDTIKNYYK